MANSKVNDEGYKVAKGLAFAKLAFLSLKLLSHGKIRLANFFRVHTEYLVPPMATAVS